MFKKKTIQTLIVAGVILLPKFTLAHCPLCTIGAGALVLAGTWLGVSTAVLGILIGGLAMSMGLWFGNLIKKQYLPYQKLIIALAVFLSTIFPLTALALDYFPLYISLFGEYGTIFHKTYVVNKFVFGGFLGGLAVIIAPYLSRGFSKIAGRRIAYQGLITTLLLLVVLAAVVELAI